MSPKEIQRIVFRVEAKTGWTFSLQEMWEILMYTKRKAALNRKDEEYVPILFENELRDFVMRKVINDRGRKNECVRSVI